MVNSSISLSARWYELHVVVPDQAPNFPVYTNQPLDLGDPASHRSNAYYNY